MMDYLKKYMDVFLAVIVMFISVIVNLQMKQEAAVIDYVKLKTKDFLDGICVNGYFSAEIYEAFLKGLGSGGEHFKIEITHKKNMWEPVYEDDKFTGSVMAYTEENHTDAILDKLYAEGTYSVEIDDLVEITAIHPVRLAGFRLSTRKTKSFARIRDALN